MLWALWGKSIDSRQGKCTTGADCDILILSSEKQYKTRFKAWNLSKYLKSDEAQQLANGESPLRERVRPDMDPEDVRIRATRSVKRRKVSAPVLTQRHPEMPSEPLRWSTASPPSPNAMAMHQASHLGNVTPRVQRPSIEVNERFLFVLRDYTHEACFYGHWNPEALSKHYSGRQASRSLSSDLTAGTKRFENGKQDLAEFHWTRALTNLQKPDLFQTWYHETPIRLLFEVGRVAHHGHRELAARLMNEVRVQAQKYLDKSDKRHALFTIFGELPVPQLRDLHERAALSLRTGLESRVEKQNPLLYEVRLNRALDLLWYDAKTDLTKWLPPIEEVDQAFGPDSPNSVYFLLLEAYRLVASGSYAGADLVCSQVSGRLKALKGILGRIDPLKIGLAYRRLGRQQYEKERHEDARRTFNTALMYIGKDKLSDLVEIYQYQEKLAKHANDEEDVNLWKSKLQQLEQDTMEQEQAELLPRAPSVFPEAFGTAVSMSNNYSHGDFDPNALAMTDPSNIGTWPAADAHRALFGFTDEPGNLLDSGMSALEVSFFAPAYTNVGSVMPLNDVEDLPLAPGNLEWIFPNTNAANSPRSMTI